MQLLTTFGGALQPGSASRYSPCSCFSSSPSSCALWLGQPRGALIGDETCYVSAARALLGLPRPRAHYAAALAGLAFAFGALCKEPGALGPEDAATRRVASRPW